MPRQRVSLVEQKSVTVWRTEYTCSRCGKEINPGWDEPRFANELIILLNDEQCVAQRFRKDLCTACLEPLWQDLCQVLGVDPDDISGSDFREDDL